MRNDEGLVWFHLRHSHSQVGRGAFSIFASGSGTDMTDFSVRSDNVDVEQIMRQIRARIREKRGVDYTEEEIRELANVKLEKFLDPRGVRSDLLQQYRQARETALPPNYTFEDTTLFETHRGPLAFIRRLLKPVLKLFFNPNPLIEALHIQSKLNEAHAAIEPLHFEIIHNLVLELTRTSIEVKNLKMRIESMSSRLDFDERRARALEGVVQYRPGAVPPLHPPTGQSAAPAGQHNELDNEGNERRARRRRRRGRRRPTSAAGGPEADYGEAGGIGTRSGVEESPGHDNEIPSDDAEVRDEARHERSEPARHEAEPRSGRPATAFASRPEARPPDVQAERSTPVAAEDFAPAERRDSDRRPDVPSPADPSSSES